MEEWQNFDPKTVTWQQLREHGYGWGTEGCAQVVEEARQRGVPVKQAFEESAAKVEAAFVSNPAFARHAPAAIADLRESFWNWYLDDHLS